MTTAVLTDSTACLPPELAEHAGVAVIPLHVQVGRSTLAEGVDITVAEVAELLRAGKERVGTSRPAPGEFVVAFRDLAESAGADSIVAVLLSSAISGTVEAAQLAGMPELNSRDDLQDAARRIHGHGVANVVIKAARIFPDQAVNLFFDGQNFTWFEFPRLPTSWTHGAGCTFSACVTAELAKHGDVLAAVKTAGEFVHAALLESFPLNRHAGPVYHKAMAKRS